MVKLSKNCRKCLNMKKCDSGEKLEIYYKSRICCIFTALNSTWYSERILQKKLKKKVKWNENDSYS